MVQLLSVEKCLSIKEVSNDVTDMFEVPSDDQSLRISMENRKEYVW